MSNTQCNPAAMQDQLLQSVSRAVLRGSKRKHGRQVSKARAATIEQTLIRGVVRMWALGHHIPDVSHIGDDHLQALVLNLRQEGYSESSIRYYVAAFRQLGRWENKSCLTGFQYQP